VIVTVTDAAGNQMSAAYTVNVKTDIDSVLRLLALFEQEGRVGGPLAAQLRNAVQQAKHQADAGHAKQAVKHLDDALKHLNNGPMKRHVTAEAKQALETDLQTLQQLGSN
jgi:hypothetical protein